MNRNKGPNILLFAIFTTITIFVWIGFEVYKVLNPLTLETIPDSVLLPLDPTLDQDVLKKLESRRNFTDSEINSLLPLELPSPTPTPEASTESAVPTQL